MTAGYVTDVLYTDQYFPIINPDWLRFVAAMNKCDVTARPDFNYLEIGCGSGLSLAVNAKLHPEASFYGFDLLPEHIEKAKESQKTLDADNVQFWTADITKSCMDPSLMGKMDIIVLHGFISWVDEGIQAAAYKLAGDYLAPGGLLFVSYNAMPGSTTTRVIQRLMENFTSNKMPTLERAADGIEFLKWLQESKSGLLNALPKLALMIPTLEEKDLHYIAHEYFTGHHEAFFFREVVDALPQDMNYAGSAIAYQNHPQMCLLPQSIQELTNITRIEFESRKDVLADIPFRADIFHRPGDISNPVQINEMPIYLAAPLGELSRSAMTPIGEMAIEGKVADLIFETLAKGPRTLKELEAIGMANGYQPGHVTDTVHIAIAITDQIFVSDPAEIRALTTLPHS